jgi:hypothetical protein
MKCLTLMQPWASLIVHGYKRYETRSWVTSHRGPLLIHAGRRFPEPVREMCMQLPFAGCLRHMGVLLPSQLPLGAVVGVVTVVDCIPASDLADTLDPRERQFGNFADGRYAWLLAGPVPLAVPVPCPGRLGVFELPEPIVAACGLGTNSELRSQNAERGHFPHSAF